MRLHCLQHVPFEDSAYIKTWASTHPGIQFSRTMLCHGESLPTLESFDWLVILGGPMAAYEEHLHNWLREEKRLIRDSIDDGKVVLGICLGNQLISEVMGGKVSKMPCKEIGWHTVHFNEQALKHPLLKGIPASITCMHWHGDTCTVPPGATLLGRSDCCSNQAFVYSDRILGLQFHLEFSEETIRRLVAHCHEQVEGVEAAQAKYVQGREEILKTGGVAQANRYMHQILENIWRHFGDKG